MSVVEALSRTLFSTNENVNEIVYWVWFGPNTMMFFSLFVYVVDWELLPSKKNSSIEKEKH